MTKITSYILVLTLVAALARAQDSDDQLPKQQQPAAFANQRRSPPDNAHRFRMSKLNNLLPRNNDGLLEDDAPEFRTYKRSKGSKKRGGPKSSLKLKKSNKSSSSGSKYYDKGYRPSKKAPTLSPIFEAAIPTLAPRPTAENTTMPVSYAEVGSRAPTDEPTYVGEEIGADDYYYDDDLEEPSYKGTKKSKDGSGSKDKSGSYSKEKSSGSYSKDKSSVSYKSSSSGKGMMGSKGSKGSKGSSRSGVSTNFPTFDPIATDAPSVTPNGTLAPTVGNGTKTNTTSSPTSTTTAISDTLAPTTGTGTAAPTTATDTTTTAAPSVLNTTLMSPPSLPFVPSNTSNITGDLTNAPTNTPVV